MSVTRKHLAAIPLIAIAISLISISSCRTTTVEAKKWTIVVGPDPCELKEHGQPAGKQKVSKKNRDYVIWVSASRESLEIRIHVPANCPAPFPGFTNIGTDKNGYNIWSKSDPVGVVFSGVVNPDSCETDDNGYKYDQILGTSRECDGWIIVKG
jgi:hypothetical protein